jgi:hypothetical protein
MTDGMEIKAEMIEGGLFRQSRYQGCVFEVSKSYCLKMIFTDFA